MPKKEQICVFSIAAQQLELFGGGGDLGGCLYNGVKLVSYFSDCIGSASLCSILKMHQRIRQLQGTWLLVRAGYEIRVSGSELESTDFESFLW